MHQRGNMYGSIKERLRDMAVKGMKNYRYV